MEMEKIAHELLSLWNLSGQLHQLDGYGSLNYRVDLPDGQRFVLKLTTEPGMDARWQAEHAAMKHLARTNGEQLFPLPQPSSGGLTIVKQTFGAQTVWAQLLSWLEGTFFAEAQVSTDLLKNFGRVMGKTDQQLANFQHHYFSAQKHEWDLYHLNAIQGHLQYIPDPADRRLVDYFLLQIDEHLRPQYPFLRHQIIHNDFNNWNVLTRGDEVCGVIDFGDMCDSTLIHELGVAIAYSSMDQDDPLEAAALVVSGFHAAYPLEEKELELIYYAIAARLCQSLLMSSYSQHQYPDNDYITVSQKPAWKLLYQWIEINPLAAANRFREVCGFPITTLDATSAQLERRHQHVSSSLSTSYREPISMVQAGLQFMYAADGKSYLDAYNNIIHVGHCHPKVVRSAQRQIASLNTNTRYLYAALEEYTRELAALFPDPLNKVFLVNSGSAASDLAIRLAQTHTDHEDLVVMEHGYHGNTRMGIEISHYKFGDQGGDAATARVHVTEMPDTYRGPHKGDDGLSGRKYAQEAIERIKSRIAEGRKVAAFIAEPVIGCGGQVPLPKGYLNEIYPFVRSHGGVVISDEVQTGFGRVGSNWWGFQQHDVCPDIVVLGKPIGNGHPLAAVVTTDEIAASFDNGVEFFSSFGGNPVSCEIGLAVLEVIKSEKLRQNAQEVGSYLKTQLQALREKHHLIGDVRGSGLFLGIELVRNRETLEPAGPETTDLANAIKEAGILVSTDGPHHNVIKIKPPITFSRAHADRLVKTIDECLTQISSSRI